MAPLPMFEGERQQKLPRVTLSPNDTVSGRHVGITESLGTGEIIGPLNTRNGIHDTKNGKTKRDCTKTDNEELSVDLLPEYLQNLVAGSGVCGDSYASFSKPEWFDEEKFRCGQRFALKHMFSIIYCELISLMVLFIFRGGLEPLIFTGKSDTPFKAFKRYMSTVSRVKSWYEGDIWDVDSIAHKNLKTVRRMHDTVRMNMNNSSEETLADKVTLFANKKRAPSGLIKQHDVVAGEFRASCPFLKSPLVCSESVYMNQCDMAITQFGFSGLLLLFPDKFGIHGATKEELEGFSHFWRMIGYLLGIEDRYNLCDGSLETVRQRCRDLIDHWVRPSFGTLSRDWLHMSKCVFSGLNYFLPCSTFEVLFLYLCNVLEINTPKLKASLNIVQYCVYQFTVAFFSYLITLPGCLVFYNWLIHFSIHILRIVGSCNN